MRVWLKSHPLVSGALGAVLAWALLVLFTHMWNDHLIVDAIRMNAIQQQQQQQQAQKSAPGK